MKLEYSLITRTVCLFLYIHFILYNKSSISAVPVAQWIARWASNSKAVGSIPTRDGFFESISKRPYKTEI
ncbi:hypothetical protein T12_6356 [Trichinella patagoniensis]|uniref:Uncharacterized protein n=1 Tax=Trichinella patagoniensis TaxID=990121 RepID=A0A0V0ZC10_9BILA|nr:hypothetical protein T12_6356 [Trichinella patagoniensis]